MYICYVQFFWCVWGKNGDATAKGQREERERTYRAQGKVTKNHMSRNIYMLQDRRWLHATIIVCVTPCDKRCKKQGYTCCYCIPSSPVSLHNYNNYAFLLLILLVPSLHSVNVLLLFHWVFIVPCFLRMVYAILLPCEPHPISADLRATWKHAFQGNGIPMVQKC